MTADYPLGGLALLIPAYNAASHLPRLFASVEAQTTPFDEVWVYDDCSNDDTKRVAEGHGARVIRGETNRGCSVGKNVLAGRTECRWIHFHDSDDALMPGFVECAQEWMRDDRFDVVLFGFEERDEVSGSLIETWRFDRGRLEEDPVAYSITTQINPFCGLYRRDAFLRAGGYDTDPAVLYNEDVAMHCRLARAGLAFTADERVLIVNYRRADSMSARNQKRCLAAHYEVMKKTAAEVAPKYFRDIAQRLWVVAGGSAAHLDWETADDAAMLAMRLADPGKAGNDRLFSNLCRVSPRFAVRIREVLIRLVKPQIRRGYPGWRIRRRVID